MSMMTGIVIFVDLACADMRWSAGVGRRGARQNVALLVETI